MQRDIYITIENSLIILGCIIGTYNNYKLAFTVIAFGIFLKMFRELVN